MPKFSEWSRRGVIASLGGAIVAACTRENDTVQSQERELVLVNAQEIVGIDPARTGYLFSKMEITETLLGATDDGRPLPGLAASWSLSDDKRVWSFKLREGAVFHDRTPVTPEAVAFVLNRARKQPGVFDYVEVETIEAQGDAVVIQMASPSNLLGSILAHYSTSIYAPSSFDDKGLALRVIGSGPYEMTDLSNQGFALNLAPTWRGPRPAITRVRYISVSRAETRSLMAESGQADIVYDLDPASLSRLRTRPELTVLTTMIPRTVQLNMNAGHPFLKDVRARRALSLAIDRNGIANGLLRDPSTRADQLFPPVLKGWHADGLAPLTTDRAEASRLLSELGWAGGPDGVLTRGSDRFRLRFLTYINRPELPPIATAIQAQLRLVGIETDISVDNQSAVPAAHRDGSLELALVARGYVNIADPAGTLSLDFLEEGGDWGATNWSDPDLVSAIRELSVGAQGERVTALRNQVAEVLHAELPVIPVVWYNLDAAHGSRIGNFSLDLLERSYRISSLSWAA